MKKFLCKKVKGIRYLLYIPTAVLFIIVVVNSIPPASRDVTVPLSSPMGEHCVELPLASDKSFKVSFELHTFEELNQLHGRNLQKGGHHSPVLCKPDQKVAIVIPYRDRENHLKMWLNNMHPFLKKQSIDYTIFVIEQLSGSKFNRGMIKNIGFIEARKIRDFDCFFFHDIDMVPNDYANVYRCGQHPRQHAKSLPRWNHAPQQPSMFGGVISVKSEQFIKANGYPNIYFEWGAEDDELGERLRHHNMKIIDYPFEVTTYEEFGHKESKKYVNTHLFKRWQSRMNTDGLNSIQDSYMVTRTNFTPLYTLISVNIDMAAVRQANNGEILEPWGGYVPNFMLDWYARFLI